MLMPIGAVLQASAHPGISHLPHFHLPVEGLAMARPALCSSDEGMYAVRYGSGCPSVCEQLVSGL